MQKQGYLEGRDMATTFNMLRANDLIWSFVVNNYLLGKEPFPFDLLYWNGDSTRMPAAMHSFYLRNMYQENLLVAAGRHHARRRADRSAQDQDAGLHPVDARGPYRAVEIDLRRDAALCRAGQVRAVGLGPYRRRRQPAGQQIRPLRERQAAADARRLARRRDGAPRARGGRLGGLDRRTTAGGEVPARHPGDGKLKPIEDAPGSYVKVRAEE